MENRSDILEFIMNRRSCRSYSPEVPDRSLLSAVVETGRHAPSSRNLQANRFYVITDPGVLADISRIASQQLESWAGKDCLYGAPVLVLVTGMRDNVCALQDVGCIMENMMLAASAAGLGSCWINHPFHLRNNSVMLELLDSIGVSREEMVTGALALGLPLKVSHHPKRLTGNPVVWIEET